MVRGRAVASGLAIVVLIGLCGGCSSSSKSGAAAQHARTAAQTQALAKARRQAAAARLRLAAAERRVAAQRRAIDAAIRRHNHPPTTRPTPTAAPPTVATIAPTPGAVAPGATTTTQPPATVASAGGSVAAADLAAIQKMLGQLNSAFRTSVAAGIAASELANYYVSAGVYPSAQCTAFETAGGAGVVSETLAVQPGSLAPAPGLVDPVLRAVPQGRIYSVVLDEIQTIVTTGEQRQLSVGTHVSVLPGGSARLFLRCS